MLRKQWTGLMRKRSGRIRVILGIALTVAAVQLPAQPSSSEIKEPEIFPAAFGQVVAQREIEPEAGEPARGEDQQVVDLSQMEVAELILEKERYKNLSLALSKERWFTLIAGVVIGGLLTASVGGMLNM